MPINKVEAYKTPGGLESDLSRAIAQELMFQLPEGVNPNSKVLSFSECLEVVKHRHIIEGVFKLLDTLSDKKPPLFNKGDGLD